MLNILKYKDSDTILDIILITFARVVLAAGLCFFSFYLAVASTMGPTIAPEVWVGSMQLDMIIRIGVLIFSICLTLFATVWLIYPLLRYLYKKTTDRKSVV